MLAETCQIEDSVDLEKYRFYYSVFTKMSDSDELVRQTKICITGGGPAGMVLGYLLSKCGIETLVLESQQDFDRDFRGDTLHAGVMELFDTIGLADSMLEIPHQKIKTFSLGDIEIINFSWLKTRFPYITMMAQSEFLGFLSIEAKKSPAFQLEMGAKVRELIRDSDSDKVTGVRYRKDGETISVVADLTIACDGRGSRLRKESGLVSQTTSDPLEVLWFRLPKTGSGSNIQSGPLTGGRLPLILLERSSHYQIAAVIAPGRFTEIRSEGLPAFHQRIKEASPALFDIASETIDSWKKVAFLHVEGSRLDNWHAPGLLLIGDAAHVMTPVGGVGINYAIWDAFEAANVLVPVIKSGANIESQHLEEVQRRRERPTKRMQRIQKVVGRRVLNTVASDESRRLQLPFFVPLLVGLPGIRALLPRIIALGGKRTQCNIVEYFE